MGDVSNIEKNHNGWYIYKMKRFEETSNPYEGSSLSGWQELANYKAPSWFEMEKRNGTELVLMGGNKDIELDTDGKRIATFGLGGCTAVCVLAKTKGKLIGYIQHYPPIERAESIKALEDFSKRSDNIYAVAIMSPGEWMKDEESGKWIMTFKDDKLTSQLADCCIKTEEEKTTRMINVPYSEDSSGRYGEGTLATGIRNGEVYIEAEGMPIIRETIDSNTN